MSALPGALTRNWRLKLSAFGLAVILWAVVQADMNAASGFVPIDDVPVVAQVSDMDWMVEGEPSPASVMVGLESPPTVLPAVRPQTAVVQIPIERVVGQDTVIQLRRDWVRLEGGSPGYTVQDISPATVRLSFQRTRTELLPVALRTEGDLPEELALAAPIGLQPQVVRVRGAAPRVEELDSVVLEPLDLSDVDASGIYTVDVDSASVSGVTATPSQVSLGVRLEPAAERVLENVPVSVQDEAGPVADSFEVQPSSLDVTLRGAGTQVSSADPERVRAVVTAASVEGLEPGFDRRVPISLRGVPDLVRAFAPVDSVTVRRPPEGPTGDVQDPPGDAQDPPAGGGRP